MVFGNLFARLLLPRDVDTTAGQVDEVPLSPPRPADLRRYDSSSPSSGSSAAGSVSEDLKRHPPRKFPLILYGFRDPSATRGSPAVGFLVVQDVLRGDSRLYYYYVGGGSVEKYYSAWNWGTRNGLGCVGLCLGRDRRG